MTFIISSEEKEILELFNNKANDVINSSFVKEAKEKDISFTLSGNIDKKTGNWATRYEVIHHNTDFINSVILPLRMFIQNNERISIHNISLIYGQFSISDYKKTFDTIRKYLNDYLDETAKTFLDDQPTKRELLETIVYGELVHLNPEKSEKLEKWKSNDMYWNLAFFEFQKILHEFIDILKMFQKINQLVLEKHG